MNIKLKFRALRQRGIAIPMVVGALIIFGIFAWTLLFTSKEEYRLLQKTIYRERARLIAEAGLAKGSAMIFQNEFEQRWYKQVRSKYGFTASFTGEISGGEYEVRAEDIINTLRPDMVGGDVVARQKRVSKLKYNRIDLFSRGTYGDQSVIVYQAVVLKPEEKVYSYDTELVVMPDGSPATFYSNIIQR